EIRSVDVCCARCTVPRWAAFDISHSRVQHCGSGALWNGVGVGDAVGKSHDDVSRGVSTTHGCYLIREMKSPVLVNPRRREHGCRYQGGTEVVLLYVWSTL
ncbi:hypothetical protein SPRG_21413, partial [Saprolegnia parasitica CBS 223.65]